MDSLIHHFADGPADYSLFEATLRANASVVQNCYAVLSHPCSSGPRSASLPRVLPSFFTRQLKCAFKVKRENQNPKSMVLNWLLTLRAIRNITDKDDGPSEPPWTAAKSALGQGCPSRWLDKANGCRRRLRIAVIFRASAGLHKGPRLWPLCRLVHRRLGEP